MEQQQAGHQTNHKQSAVQTASEPGALQSATKQEQSSRITLDPYRNVFNFYYFSSSEFLQVYLVSPSLVRTAATGADWGKVFQRKTFSDHLKHNYKKRTCLSFINASKYEVVYCLLFTLKIFFDENFCQLD